jgi:hypothetical protein
LVPADGVAAAGGVAARVALGAGSPGDEEEEEDDDDNGLYL